MSTYEHTVKLRQKEDAKKSRLSPSLASNAKNKNNLRSEQQNKISTISNQVDSPPLDAKRDSPPPPPIFSVTNESGGILPALPPLPPLKHTPQRNKMSNAHGADLFDLNGAKLNDKPLNKSLNTSLNNTNTNASRMEHALPCITPKKHYLELNDMQSDSRDSSSFPTNRTDVDATDSTYQSLQTHSNERRTANITNSSIIKLPKLEDDSNRISALSSTLESKRKHRKQLVNLSSSPPSLSNRSTPEPNTVHSKVKYLNSSNLKKLDNQSSRLSEVKAAEFRTLKNYTPTSDSDDDIIIGTKQFNSNSYASNA